VILVLCSSRGRGILVIVSSRQSMLGDQEGDEACGLRLVRVGITEISG
jgi:hypothetical protein